MFELLTMCQNPYKYNATTRKSFDFGTTFKFKIRIFGGVKNSFEKKCPKIKIFVNFYYDKIQ